MFFKWRSKKELLLHIGIDTVSLKGSGFQSDVATGDRVSAGQTLIEFDLEAVRAAGLPVISPVIVTSMEETPPELECLYGQVRSGSDFKSSIKAIVHRTLPILKPRG